MQKKIEQLLKLTADYLSFTEDHSTYSKTNRSDELTIEELSLIAAAGTMLPSHYQDEDAPHIDLPLP